MSVYDQHLDPNIGAHVTTPIRFGGPEYTIRPISFMFAGNHASAVAGQARALWEAPFAGKVVGASVRCASRSGTHSITEFDVRINGTSCLTANMNLLSKAAGDVVWGTVNQSMNTALAPDRPYNQFATYDDISIAHIQSGGTNPVTIDWLLMIWIRALLGAERS